MEIETKNKIGLYGFGIILTCALLYVAYLYWPVTWTKNGKLLRADLTTMQPVEFKDKLAATNINALSDAQKAELGKKIRTYMDGLERDQRRELMMSMWGDDADKSAQNMRELMRAQMRQVAFDYIATPEADRPAKLDEMMDQRRGRRGPASSQPAGSSTEPSTRPNWQARAANGAGGGMGGGGGRGPNANRTPDPGRMAGRVADGLKNTSADERAAMRKVRDDMNARRNANGNNNSGNRRS